MKPRNHYQSRRDATCPCGRRFAKKSNAIYCLDCKVLRMTQKGRDFYEDLIK